MPLNSTGVGCGDQLHVARGGAIAHADIPDAVGWQSPVSSTQKPKPTVAPIAVAWERHEGPRFTQQATVPPSSPLHLPPPEHGPG